MDIAKGEEREREVGTLMTLTLLSSYSITLPVYIICWEMAE